MIKSLLSKIQYKFLDVFGYSYWSKYPLFYQYKPHEYSIKGDDLDNLYHLLYNDFLEPGDILLSRKDFCFTSLPIGIPGDFKHTGLYVGKHNNRYTVIHAKASGVTVENVSNFWWADHIAIVRPRNLSKEERQKAAEKAFDFAGRPYDFDFRYTDHKQLFCTELIGACYEQFKTKFKFKLVEEQKLFKTRRVLLPDNVFLSDVDVIFISHKVKDMKVYKIKLGV